MGKASLKFGIIRKGTAHGQGLYMDLASREEIWEIWVW